ncbi:uncharacterized protein [Argopecten irradians]|uniref:uncharacterized protein n=1 Tax=Argopecten irradians TaxID=31199 RepID=UPI00371C72D2
MTGFRQYTFYWKIDDSTASESTLSFIEPELPTEAPLLEKHFVARNIECDFQPTTNLSEICTSINDDSVLVSNESDCFHLCEMKDKCSGVTLRSVGITCYLQYCGEPEYTTNVYLRFLSKQVTRNCSYTSKGPGTDGECGYISSTTSSLEQCQDTCTHQPDCRGIGYDTSTMLCRPSICPQYQYRQGISDSLSFHTKVCEDVVYYVNHGHNSVGSCGSFDTIQVRTENECQSLCSDNQHCLGVTLNEPRYECQQYTCPTASPSVYTNGTSYLKVCGSKSDTTMYTHTSVVSTIDVMSPSSTAADTTTSISYSQYEVTPLTSRSTSLYETLQLFPSQTSSYNNMVLSQSSHESESGTQQVTSSQNSLYDTTYATSSQVESLLYEATHMTSRPTIPYESTHNHVSQYKTSHLTSTVSSSYETKGINYMNPGLISQYETSYVTPSYFNRYETTGMTLSDVSQYEKTGMTFNPTSQNETTNLISSSSSTYEPTEISPSSVSQYDTTHLASSYTKSYQTTEILPSRVSDTSQQTQISLHETTQIIPSEYSFFSTTTIAAIESVTPSLELPMTLSSVENSHSTFINIEGISISETTATLIEDSHTRAAGNCTEHSIYLTSSLHSINSYVEESVTTSHAVPSATLSSYPSMMHSNLMVFHGEFCSCICRMENKTIHARIRELISTIKLDKSQLSSSTRKLVSVDDRRTSSKNIGTVGIALLATIGFVIVLSDVFAIFCKQ